MKKNRFKIKYSKMISFFYAMFAFWSLNPYFTWSTYMNGMFGKMDFFPIKGIWAILAILSSMYYIAKKKKIETHTPKPAIMMLGITAFLLICCGGSNSNPFDTAWLAFISFFCLLLLPREIQKDVLDTFALIFTLFLIIPIITFILTEVFKFNIPYSILYSQDIEKNTIGVFYKHRFLSAQYTQYGNNNVRFNGVFYEAGVIGTICGLLLGAYEYQVIGRKNWKQMIWLLCGICSFSLSFILFTGLFFIIRNLSESKVKNIIVLICIILMYFAFISINFSTPKLQSIQRRLTFSGFKLQGDNRVSQGYKNVFNNFYEEDIFKQFFGYGRDSFANIQNEEKFDGSSYKSILYDYGYVGFALYIFWFVYIIYYVAKKFKICFKRFAPLLIMQLGNIYQKPDIFAIYYMIIFLGGIILIVEKEKKNELPDKCSSINL